MQVEAVSGSRGLRGARGDLDRGYTRLKGLPDHEFVVAFYLASVNRSIARAEASKDAAKTANTSAAGAPAGGVGDEPSSTPGSEVPTQRTDHAQQFRPKQVPRQSAALTRQRT